MSRMNWCVLHTCQVWGHMGACTSHGVRCPTGITMGRCSPLFVGVCVVSLVWVVVVNLRSRGLYAFVFFGVAFGVRSKKCGFAGKNIILKMLCFVYFLWFSVRLFMASAAISQTHEAPSNQPCQPRHVWRYVACYLLSNACIRHDMELVFVSSFFVVW